MPQSQKYRHASKSKQEQYEVGQVYLSFSEVWNEVLRDKEIDFNEDPNGQKEYRDKLFGNLIELHFVLPILTIIPGHTRIYFIHDEV